MYRKEGKWHIYQEVKGLVIPGSEGTYPLDKSPWIPLRFTKIDGEDYGRGYVEEYLGDLRSLEALTMAIVEGSAISAKVLFLVNPNGVTEQRTLVEAPNGAVRTGNAEDVTVLQVQKNNDFNTAYQMIEAISQRLAFAFLMNTAVQRGGERVTAEEIRYMRGELKMPWVVSIRPSPRSSSCLWSNVSSSSSRKRTRSLRYLKVRSNRPSPQVSRLLVVGMT